MGIPGSSSQGQARLGRYELLARLATGGMGEIFLARLEGAEGFEKLYVVKRILAHLADDARFRQMLVAEARIASKMSHPNICQVFELGETEGQLYIVMEYLEGISLLPMLRRFSKTQQQLDLGFIAGVIQQVTDAMNYAHDLKDRGGESLGIIHRDVTPSNIFLTESGVAKVLDFGIAKAKGASTQTQEGTVKGKYAYMAPEQLRGASIDRRVDLFALGVVLYEMLALRRLFQRKTDYLTFRAVMEQPIPDIRRYRPDMPDGVADVLTRALDRDPGNRYETARQFGSAVLDAVGQYQRPWTQGEISDFVRHYFAEEIGKRSQQVATVVSRTSSGMSTRSTMPLFVTPDEGSQTEEGDDEEFPSVETEVEGAPPWMSRQNPNPPPSNQFGPQPGSGEFSHSGTPPPFGLETTGSAPSLQPLRGGSPVLTPGPNAPPVMVMPQRSFIWPVVAILMVAIAGGALFLVWKQMQSDRPPSEIKITQEGNNSDNGGSSNGSGETKQMQTNDGGNAPDQVGDGSAAEGSGAGIGSGKKIGPGPGSNIVAPRDKGRPKTYDEAVAQHIAELKACAAAHPESLPTDGSAMSAKITIAAAGTTKHVTIVPDGVNATPLGACLRNALLAARWPTAGGDVPITLPLTLKPRS
ncbi:MAG TPA: protein kinase [Kofleriaceae bacterium]|nr:protein kinase [Kofleriaceae bacterium]